MVLLRSSNDACLRGVQGAAISLGSTLRHSPYSDRPCSDRPMAATRLSDSQKTELVSGFQAGESTQALADRFGCSANTVTRVARTLLGAVAYEQLKRQRLRGGSEAAQAELLELPLADTTGGELDPAPAPAADFAEVTDSAELGDDTPDRAAAFEDQDEAAPVVAVVFGREEAEDEPETGEEPESADLLPVAIDEEVVDPGVVAEIDAEVDSDLDSEYGDDEDDITDPDEDDEVVDVDQNVDDDQAAFLPIAVLGFGDDDHGSPAELRPLASAQLPASVYMLVDKTVELQARPLSEMVELGQLPPGEQERRALVVFTNPRQAKRLCGRTQRVIKLPDTRVIERTAPYLLNQGISRVVIEGALYALPGS
jgi:hypothetical protein